MDIKETKEVVAFAISLAEAIDASFKDGFDLSDLASFIDPVIKSVSAIDGFALVDDELADLDDAEKDELISYVQDEFDIEDDVVEEVVERAIAAIMELVPLLKLINRDE